MRKSRLTTWTRGGFLEDQAEAFATMKIQIVGSGSKHVPCHAKLHEHLLFMNELGG